MQDREVMISDGKRAVVGSANTPVADLSAKFGLVRQRNLARLRL